MSTFITAPFVYDHDPSEAGVFMIEWYRHKDEIEILEVWESTKYEYDYINKSPEWLEKNLLYEVVMSADPETEIFELTDGQWDSIQDHVKALADDQKIPTPFDTYDS